MSLKTTAIVVIPIVVVCLLISSDVSTTFLISSINDYVPTIVEADIDSGLDDGPVPAGKPRVSMHQPTHLVTSPAQIKLSAPDPNFKPVPSGLANRIKKSRNFKTMSKRQREIANSKKAWEKTDEVYPAAAIISPDICPDDQMHLRRVTGRLNRWGTKNNKEGSYIDQTGIWQGVVNDKIGQTFFAHHIIQANPEKKDFLAFPRVYACDNGGPEFLADWEPSSAASKTGYVVKDLDGFSSHGVYVLPDGFGGKELLSGDVLSRKDVIEKLKKWKATRILIEEYIPKPEDSSATVDYKFWMFGERAMSIHVAYNRGQPTACFSYHAMDWSRVDDFGCFHDKEKRKPFYDPLCSDVPKPDLLPHLIEAAKLYGKHLGVFYRVDLFVHPATNQVVLGEFTPWPFAGGYHCHATFDSKTGYDGCALGREWAVETTIGLKEDYTGPPVFEGGPGAPAPEWLQEFYAMNFNQRCARAVEYSNMYD
jgi:hypothetical protein